MNNLLYVIFLFFANSVFSQIDSSFIKNKIKIDNIIEKETRKGTGDAYIGYFKPSQLINEKEIIEYLSNNKYDTLSNIRRVIFELIYSIGQSSAQPEIRQLAVNELLDMSMIVIDHKDYVFNFNRSDFNVMAKKRVIEIAKMIKNDKEIHFRLQGAIANASKNITEEASLIAKKKKISETFVKDSILKEAILWETAYFKKAYIDKFILAIGWLDMYEEVPLLERMSVNPDYEGYYRFVKAALVRLGKDKYLDNDLLENHIVTISYLRSQKALINYIKPIFSDEKFECIDNITVPMAIPYIYDIQRFVLNFPKKYKLSEDWCLDYNKKQIDNYIVSVREWFRKNEGKYVFDPECW